MNAVTPPPLPSPFIVLSPVRAGIPATGGTLEVLVRVQAPPKPQPTGQSAATPRPPFRLALVVDRSGSMDGQPLAEALRCVNHIAGRLQSADQVAVVLYDNKVNLAVALRQANDASAVQAALAGVVSGGSTDLFAGWEAGARQLEAGPKESISRVILLSDGQANHGLVDQAEIEAHCAKWLAAGVSTTTVGLGRSFNEELMIGMARAGGGQQYYGQTAEDLFDGFDEELALLEALYLRQLRVKLIAGSGVIVEPLGLVRHNADQSIELPDLAWSAEAWVLVRLHVTAATQDAQQPILADMAQRALLTVSLQAQSVEGVPMAAHSPVLALASMDAAAWAALPQDEMVLQRLQEVQFGEAGVQVRRLLMAGEVEAANTLLQQMETDAAQHPWLMAKVQQLKLLAERDAEMAQKELSYSSIKMSSRLAASGIQAAYRVDETDSTDVPAFLRRKIAEGRGRKA